MPGSSSAQAPLLLPCCLCGWDQFLLLLGPHSAPAPSSSIVSWALLTTHTLQPLRVCHQLRGVTDPFSSYCHCLNVLPWKRLRVLSLSQGHHRLLFAQLWPMEALEWPAQGNQPSPTGPLQSPALRCLLEKHFPGWFPCLSPAVFVFDGTDCFQLADFVSCSVAGALTLGVTTGGEGTFLSRALPFLLSSAC